MNVTIQRVYDPPAKTGGPRVLIDRLWPRGISKEKAHLKAWMKEATPSNELRTWFHANPETRLKAFQQKYKKELAANRKEIKAMFLPYKPSVTLVTAVKDLEHSHIPVIKEFLKKL